MDKNQAATKADNQTKVAIEGSEEHVPQENSKTEACDPPIFPDLNKNTTDPRQVYIYNIIVLSYYTARLNDP